MTTRTDIAKKGAAPALTDQTPNAAPYTDIFENDKEFLIVADLPGVASDAVEIEVREGELHLSAPQSAREGLPGYQPVRWTRAFWVPETVDTAHIHAELKGGVMRLHLPKSAEAQPRRITVKAG